MHSFAYRVKSELCRPHIQRACCAKAEAYGALLYCNTFNNREIRIITENPEFASRLPRLFKRAFDLKFDRLPEENNCHGKFVFQMTDPEKLEKIIHQLGYDLKQNLVMHVNFGILEDDCCRTSFLRGAFLAGGSVTDPEKRYHLELTTSHAQASREMSALLTEMGFAPRSVMRTGNSVTYFKQCEHIEDILTTIGAPAAAVEMMTTKLEKELVNNANRAMNCDIANVNKTLEAAQEQCEAIEILKDAGRLELLPKQIKETAMLRLQHPELSLTQLAEFCVPPVTKSCINHRMRKIMEIARDLDE